MQQIQDLKQRSLFENVRVADFIIEKDRLFAEVTLSPEEMHLYDKVYEHITIDAPSPDLVIYLQAPIEILKEHGFSNDKSWESKFIDQSKRNDIAVWDDEGNLIS